MNGEYGHDGADVSMSAEKDHSTFNAWAKEVSKAIEVGEVQTGQSIGAEPRPDVSPRVGITMGGEYYGSVPESSDKESFIRDLNELISQS